MTVKTTNQPQNIDHLSISANTNVENHPTKVGDDSFVLDNIESIIVESPEKVHHHRKNLLGKERAIDSLEVSKAQVVNDMRVMREVVDSCPELFAYMNVISPDRKAILDEHLCDTILYV